MLVNVQFLRFVAAILVVLFHASAHVRATGADQGLLFRLAENIGFAGVDVFFVISGFIMFHTTTREAGGTASIDFLKRRLARIFSGYWPFFALALVIVPWALPAQYVSVDTMTSFWLWPTPLERILLPVTWTLSYEMYFYLLFTLLVAFDERKRFFLLASLLLLVSVYNLYLHFVLDDFSAENILDNTFWTMFTTSPFLAEFFAGAVLARYMGRGSSRLGWLLLTLGAALFLGSAWLNAEIYGGKLDLGYHMVPRVLAFGVSSVLVLWGLVNLEASGWRSPKRFSLACGGASYAIYLSHTLLFAASAKLGMHTALGHVQSGWVQAIYLAFSGLIALFSVLHYRTLERWLHRKFKRALRIHAHG